MNNLLNNEIERYSRQLILPNFGVLSQMKLKNKSALIIGCGGLGCPAGLYLAACGVGRIGFIDNDTIDISNLHRQIAFNEKMIDKKKSIVLASECKLRNSSINCDAYDLTFSKENALEIIKNYDVVLDCTDNVLTRYLINDCCVILGRPLVSGSALRFDGQLTVYNYKNGPCLRCIYPKPPPKETISNCSDAGILGPVVGIIGTFQAIEAIKILSDIGDCLNGRLLIFNSLDFISKVVDLRKSKSDCKFCSKEVRSIDDYDYFQFCSNNYDDKTENVDILNQSDRITSENYKFLLQNNSNHLLIDVRTSNEFSICSLPNSINISLEALKYGGIDTYINIKNILEEKNANEIYVICRRGNDSQLAVNLLKENINNKIVVKDIIGGLHQWHDLIDKSFPKY